MSAPLIHAVILAGGAGERFWPASRRSHPKPFLRVVGGQSLLDATLERARRFAGEDRVWVVCGQEHAGALRRATGLPASRVLVEPHRRNTAMAVAWAAERIAAEDPDAVMAVLPADHHIPDPRRFAADIRRAARAARDAEVLVTLGVEPTRPDTGYGYISVGDPAGSRFAGLHRVERFVEKPNLATARRYLSQGGFLWNAGVFVWTARVFLEEVETWAGELHRALAPLRKKPKGRNRAAVEAAYRRAPSLPVDTAVMEPSRRVWTLPVSFAWSDVGTWSSLAEELGVGQRVGKGPLEGEGNRVIEGEVLAEEARGNLIWGGERLIALLGVEDLAIVDTEDVILITKLDRSPDVKRFVAVLTAKGREGLT
ncbi:MAG: mannose-1-phosphate guanylyltransferase [Deltaproteobacteria bacterium]|nr:mannose-1-phosphate guanylyltransferase [Deltaproteobacteria bacterium]MBW2417365.1 mannose-1-phosphate guanylyltransferase [Deltaproteobacteria bacterium]